jgi:hypothetical protein
VIAPTALTTPPLPPSGHLADRDIADLDAFDTLFSPLQARKRATPRRLGIRRRSLSRGTGLIISVLQLQHRKTSEQPSVGTRISATPQMGQGFSVVCNSCIGNLAASGGPGSASLSRTGGSPVPTLRLRSFFT